MNPFRPTTAHNMLASRSVTTQSASPLEKPKSSGRVSSLQRQWSTIVPAHKDPSSCYEAKSQQHMSSSQPSWQASESEWPPSPPPAKKVKSAGNLLLTDQSKPARQTSGPVSGWRSNGGTRDSGAGFKLQTNPPPQTTSFTPATGSGSISKCTSAKTTSGFQVASKVSSLMARPAPKKAGPTLKRDFPWDVATSSKSNAKKPSASASSATYNFPKTGNQQSATFSHLGNPTMSIAAKVSLSPEQQNVLDNVLRGESVFFTGSAGTGKSVLLRHIISGLKRTYASRPDAVAVTASTGMAACAIGGTTIHSFAGIGLGLEAPDKLVNKVRKNRRAAGKWMRTKVLIIDEISMVDGELFDKLEFIAQKMKKSDKPFGGIQLVIAGDFFQLPPVSKSKVFFAFNAKRWSDCVSQTVNLTQVFRQKDTTFIDMLNEMRMGELSPASIQRFRQLSREVNYDDGIVPTELYPTRHEVERSNSARLNALSSEEVVYTAHDTGKAPPEQRARDFANMMAVTRLVLKKDAQVMMIKNQSSEDGPAWLVNGLVGKVLDFVDENMTIERYMQANATDHFDDGGYPDGEDLNLTAYPPVRGALKQGDDKKAPASPSKRPSSPSRRLPLPVVEWHLPNGKREVTIVERAEFKVENLEGEIQSRRVQLPLILAWAMSIHKSQGQTLNRVKVDLGKVFEKGQIYVALSRATSLEGLQVLRFDPKKVMAHPEVVKWSKANLVSQP